KLSHVGSVFPLSPDNMRKWKGWWTYVLTDQLLVWAPGCFVGMALPALMSIQFSKYSTLDAAGLSWAQALITADGMRNAPGLSALFAKCFWLVALLAGLAVMLPSQLSIVDDFSRRWTDAIWTSSQHVRKTFKPGQVSWIYYSIL